MAADLKFLKITGFLTEIISWSIIVPDEIKFDMEKFEFQSTGVIRVGVPKSQFSGFGGGGGGSKWRN